MRKKTILIMLSSALLLSLTGCTPGGGEEVRLTVVCTTYPIYLFASSITEGVEGVAVERLDTGSASCLHDYTLSMADMKKLEKADVIAINGAGLEDFLEDALATSDAQIIDCSEGVELLESFGHDHDEDDHDGHDHGHWDPHYWMDPVRAAYIAVNLGEGLIEADPDHRDNYSGGCNVVLDMLRRCADKGWSTFGSQRHAVTGLIAFHDGFQYFADAYKLPLLAAIEEEAGSEASAHEIVEIAQLVKDYDIPVIFTEVNGSDATAKAIARETGCQVAQLTMLMDGPDDLEAYYTGILGNLGTIVNGSAGEEVVSFDAEDQTWKTGIELR